MGNYQRGESYKVINYGISYRPAPNVEILDAQDEIAAKIIFGDSVMSYRCMMVYPRQAFPRPEISCTNAGDRLRLDAPAGHSRYLWSTGETGPSIFVDPIGTYQVFVPYGIGMLSSAPFFAAPDCKSISSPTNPTLIGNFDVLGRKQEQPAAGQLLIQRFQDGSVRKRIYHE